jgi:hypothetical protein
MFPLSHNLLKCAATGAFLALSAASTSALADELVQNSGPVGPHQPMITTIGSKNVIAFYVPGNGACHLQAVIWNRDDAAAVTAGGFRVSLNPGQTASIDSAENKSLTLKCGDYAETLEAVDTDHQVASKGSIGGKPGFRWKRRCAHDPPGATSQAHSKPFSSGFSSHALFTALRSSSGSAMKSRLLSGELHRLHSMQPVNRSP